MSFNALDFPLFMMKVYEKNNYISKYMEEAEVLGG